MKKIVFFLALLILVTQSFSQTPPNSGASSASDYLKRSRNQKKAGWILLAGGTAMAVGGAITFNYNWNYGSYTATDISGFVMLGGIVADLVSIPLFISSGANKRKASILLNSQKILVPQQSAFALRSQPTLTLKIEF